MLPCRRFFLRQAVDDAARELAALRSVVRVAANAVGKRRVRAAARQPPRRLLVMASVCCRFESDECVGVLILRVLWRAWKHCRALSVDELLGLWRGARGDEGVALDAANAIAGRGGARLLVRLGRIVAEAWLAMWLAVVNTQGVAISASHLVARLRTLWPTDARGWQCDAFLARIRQWPRRRKAYAKTFRARWGVSWRRLPSRANMDAEDLLFRVPRNLVSISFWVLAGGATFGPHFWGPHN
jgi:hypothetical protein